MHSSTQPSTPNTTHYGPHLQTTGESRPFGGRLQRATSYAQIVVAIVAVLAFAKGFVMPSATATESSPSCCRPVEHPVGFSRRCNALRGRPRSAVALGRALRAIRDEAGITLAQLAHRTGLAQRWISHVERGTGDPIWSGVERLADGLGVSMAELAERSRCLRRDSR
jgi:DNA-binding XRE family transcriptional regulator